MGGVGGELFSSPFVEEEEEELTAAPVPLPVLSFVDALRDCLPLDRSLLMAILRGDNAGEVMGVEEIESKAEAEDTTLLLRRRRFDPLEERLGDFPEFAAENPEFSMVLGVT